VLTKSRFNLLQQQQQQQQMMIMMMMYVCWLVQNIELYIVIIIEQSN
jgi:hypothetical protein